MKFNRNKNSKGVRILFSILAIGFTAISVWNGFNFYNILFGLSMALLISIVFEVARLACLFTLAHRKGKLNVLTILIYLPVAGLCVFASINSFSSDVAMQNRMNQKQYEESIFKIKKTYSEQVNRKLELLNRDIKYLENKVARYQKSDYWGRRLSQIMKNRDDLVTERDRFVSQTPGDPLMWIETHSALLGVNYQTHVGVNDRIEDVNSVLKNLWGFDKTTGRNFIGIALTLVIEMAILLLTFLSVNPNREKVKPHREPEIFQRFGKKTVDRFLDLNRDHFIHTGKLLPLNKISSNLRPLKSYLAGYSRQEIRNLFE